MLVQVYVSIEPVNLFCAGMRWWLVVASVWLLVALTVPSVQARNKARNQDAGPHRGKRRRDGNGMAPSERTSLFSHSVSCVIFSSENSYSHF